LIALTDKKKEEVTKLGIEISPATKEWIISLERKFNCPTHRELVLLALKFLDDTPYEQLPPEIRGISASKTGDIPTDARTLRRMAIERLQMEIDNLVVRTTTDKRALTSMLGELRLLLKDQAKDEASAMLEELKELKSELQGRVK